MRCWCGRTFMSKFVSLVIMLNRFLCCSTLSFLAAFMIACFSFASSTTRLSVGAFLVAVSLLILWCIGTSWIHEDKFPSTAAFWGKCRATFSYGGEPATESQEPRKTILARFGILPSNAFWNKCKGIFSRGDNPGMDSEEIQSWPMKVFVRKATADRGSDSTSNEEERVAI